MAQEQIIFSTYCEDHLQERFGTHKLINSFKYFNPHYKIVLYGTKDINRVHRKYNVNYSNALPAIMLDVKEKYDSVYVCHIDSDSLVLGWLKEISTLDYEIAAQLNNPDIGDRDERQNRPKELWNQPNSTYVSPGCISTSSSQFLLQWMDLNKQIINKYGGVKSFWMADINMMNILFHYAGYKSKILDPLDGDFFYGPSANTYSKNKIIDPDHIIKEWGVNQWSSWRDIEYKDGQFYMHDKIVKLLHQSGGGNAETAIKLSYDMFNPEIVPILKEITKCNE